MIRQNEKCGQKEHNDSTKFSNCQKSVPDSILAWEIQI